MGLALRPDIRDPTIVEHDLAPLPEKSTAPRLTGRHEHRRDREGHRAGAMRDPIIVPHGIGAVLDETNAVVGQAREEFLTPSKNR